MKWLIVLYILANAAANLALIATPPAWRGLASVVIAATLVAFDITTRDRLHDAWRGDPRRLGLVIGAGALVSLAVNIQAWPVALASCVAFAAAGVADSVVYHQLRGQAWMARANGSNVVAAAVDSAAFLSIAATLGVLPWQDVPLALAGQFAAKVLGGALWSVALARRARA